MDQSFCLEFSLGSLLSIQHFCCMRRKGETRLIPVRSRAPCLWLKEPWGLLHPLRASFLGQRPTEPRVVGRSLVLQAFSPGPCGDALVSRRHRIGFKLDPDMGIGIIQSHWALMRCPGPSAGVVRKGLPSRLSPHLSPNFPASHSISG